MNYVVEVANLLTLATNESVFHPDYIDATFPSLNLAQIRKILELYAPDKYAPEPIPVEVKRFINDACRNPSVRSLTIDLEPVLALHSIPIPGLDTKEVFDNNSLSEDDDDEEYSF